jgi:shikimate dehydrogenase
MRGFGLIGYPLTHSFSKKYFEQKFREQNLADCRYDLFELSALDQLEKLLQDHPGLVGLNVTIPYKKEILKFLNATDQIPARIHACNCIRIENGKLTGYNTDITGFERSFVPLLKSHHANALVLGSGGSAEAVCYVLKKMGVNYRMVSHTGKTDLSYQDLDKKILEEHLILINTTPLGMFPNMDECPAIPYEFISSKHLLFDLVYNPAKTLFLRKGEERGAAIKNGEEMLRIQAEESWKIWNAASVG